MNQFFTLYTDTFVPISYGGKRLFNTYELVNNFIRTRISPTYKNILAKPILRDYEVNWYSPFEGLHETVDVAAQRKYFAFKDELQQHIENFICSTDPNAHYWVGLLEKVFEQENNRLFTNGLDICVVWGWEFNNYQIQRPDVDDINSNQKEASEGVVSPVVPILDPFASEEEVPTQQSELLQETLPLPEEEGEEKEEETAGEDKKPKEEFSSILYEEDEEESFKSKNRSFGEFVKEFAATYWWLLVVLLAVISMVFFIKSLIY